MADTRIIDWSGFASGNFRTLDLEHPALAARVLRPWVGKRLLINISIFRKRRSLQQNRYMWGPFITCVRTWLLEKDGHAPSKEGVYVRLREIVGHEVRIEKILGKDTISMTGKSFSQMNTVEFNEAIEFLREWFRLKGCDIPEPKGDCLWSDYAEEYD